MKKNVLSLSISAAVLSLGMVGGAQAVVTPAFGAATAPVVLLSGVGHTNIVPYYTANSVVVGGDATNGMQKTLINIVNTDAVNGKAVKVRFRGAANSDDVFDFQVFLSPSDVYAMEINQDPATGLARLASSDTSCTKPNVRTATNADLSFKTGRLDNTSGTAASRAAGTREGYVEILTMADIRPLLSVTTTLGTEAAGAGANPLFTATKHTAGTAPAANTAPTCSGTGWTNLDTDTADVATAAVLGLSRPTPSLVTNWTIVNTTNSSVYGGEAYSMAYQGAARAAAAVGNSAITDAPIANSAAMTYFPQANTNVNLTVGVSTANIFTADPLLRTATPKVTPLLQDLPDTSTPAVYTAATAATTNGPIAHAELVNGLLAKTQVVNEYLTNTSIAAATDWTFTMPTRRYGVVYDYVAGTALFNDLAGATVSTTGTGSLYFQAANAKANATRRMVCVEGITPAPFDREETSPTALTIVFSPSSVPVPSLCGEASVLTVNNASSPTVPAVTAMLASVTVSDVDATYRDGWMTMKMPGLVALVAGAAAGLPVIGNSYVRASTGTTRLGAVYRHR